MEYVLRSALDALDAHSRWILWNLFLAFIPLVLSLFLFRWHRGSRSALWWLALVVFIAFLPNAPYLLTDIIHLIRATRSGYSSWVLVVFVIPIHLTAIFLGIEAYVLSVLNQGHYLRRQGVGKFLIPAELLTHALCAIGVYLGRFIRFNSWDLVTRPDMVLLTTLNELTSNRPLIVMGVTFVMLTVCYWLLKQLTIGVLLRIRYARQGRDVFEDALG
jgi:uncharacterized membrane protein